MKPKRGERSSDLIDAHVGARIRMHRILAGLTLEQLGGLIGVTMGQVQKYESGHNRVSAGRLFEIARVLNAPILSFFEGLKTESAPRIPSAETRESQRFSQQALYA